MKLTNRHIAIMISTGAAYSCLRTFFFFFFFGKIAFIEGEKCKSQQFNFVFVLNSVSSSFVDTQLYKFALRGLMTTKEIHKINREKKMPTNTGNCIYLLNCWCITIHLNVPSIACVVCVAYKKFIHVSTDQTLCILRSSRFENCSENFVSNTFYFNRILA